MSAKKFSTPRLQWWRTGTHEKTFEGTLAHIEEFGCQVMSIRGGPETRFSYTVGAYDVFGVPELIVVGLTDGTGHAALNRALDRLRDGVDLLAGSHSNLVGEVSVVFRPVDKRWVEHVLRRDLWYYQGEDIPVLQMVYPDLEGRFQWEPDFTEYFRQPLLGPASLDTVREVDFWSSNDPTSSLFDWKFPDAPHTQAYLSETVHKKEERVTYVSHDAEDGAWQFLGDKMADGGGPVVSCLHHPVDDDPSLRELFDLPLGWYAVRETPSGLWQRYEKQEEDEGES